MLVLMVFNYIMGMPVFSFIFRMNVCMGMYVLVFVGVNQISMLVLMSMNVYMFVSVLQCDGIFDHQDCSSNHDQKPEIKLKPRCFLQE